VRRSPGRYDVTVDLKREAERAAASAAAAESAPAGAVVAGGAKEIGEHPLLVLRRSHAPWQPLVRRLLGADCKLLHSGVLLSLPGSFDQVCLVYFSIGGNGVVSVNDEELIFKISFYVLSKFSPNQKPFLA
jgi:hypothetical protein